MRFLGCDKFYKIEAIERSKNACLTRLIVCFYLVYDKLILVCQQWSFLKVDFLFYQTLRILLPFQVLIFHSILNQEAVFPYPSSLHSMRWEFSFGAVEDFIASIKLIIIALLFLLNKRSRPRQPRQMCTQWIKRDKSKRLKLKWNRPCVSSCIVSFLSFFSQALRFFLWINFIFISLSFFLVSRYIHLMRIHEKSSRWCKRKKETWIDHNEMNILSLASCKESNKWNQIIVFLSSNSAMQTNLECILNWTLNVFHFNYFHFFCIVHNSPPTSPLILIEKLYIPKRWQFMHRYFGWKKNLICKYGSLYMHCW